MKTLFLALALLSPLAHAKDCRPIVCELTQIAETNKSLAKFSLAQEANDDDKCVIFEGGSDITLSNGTDKVNFSAAEENGKIILQLDAALVEGTRLHGSANVEVTRRQLAVDPVKLSSYYYHSDGNQAGLLELTCKRSGSKNHFRPAAVL